MRRVLIALFLAAATLSLPASTALAGGSFLDPRQRSYAWGEQAVATERYSGPLRRYLGRPHVGTLAEGPFFAYLVPEDRFLRPGKPIPPYAVPLGRIRFKQLPPNSYCCLATLRFTVPEVSPGEYWIDYCNDPCTVTDVGFSAGSLLIGRTQLEARLLERIEWAGFRIDRLRRDARVTQGLRERFQDAKADADRFLSELADVRRDLADARPAPNAVPRPTPWAALSLAALLGVGLGSTGGLIFARRRDRRSRAPARPETNLTRPKAPGSRDAGRPSELTRT